MTYPNLTLYTPYQSTVINEILSNGSAPVTFTLTLREPGIIVTIKDGTGMAGTNNITVVDYQGALIDGQPFYVLNINFESIDFYWNGSAWRLK